MEVLSKKLNFMKAKLLSLFQELSTHVFESSNVSLDRSMVLLRNVDRLLVLLDPAWLPKVTIHEFYASLFLIQIHDNNHVCFWPFFINVPSVALQDGEHDDVEGGIGRVQHLLPRVHTQACHLLQDNSDEMLMVAPLLQTLHSGLFEEKKLDNKRMTNWETLACLLLSSLRYIESVSLCFIKSPWLNEGALSQEGVFNIVDEFFLLLAVYIWWQFFDEKWAQNDHLLLNISNSLYFHSYP